MRFTHAYPAHVLRLQDEHVLDALVARATGTPTTSLTSPSPKLTAIQALKAQTSLHKKMLLHEYEAERFKVIPPLKLRAYLRYMRLNCHPQLGTSATMEIEKSC